jgi:hypothetical protein
MIPKEKWKINRSNLIIDTREDAPPRLKADKGHEGGSCNRTACQQPPAIWHSVIMKKWYCARCADLIGNDPHNRRDWETDLKRHYPQGLFETRQMMDAREAASLSAAQNVVSKS